MYQDYADIYAMCSGRKLPSKELSIKDPKKSQKKSVFKEKMKEYLDIFFHRDIIDIVLNYTSDIKTTTSGISSKLRSNTENFIDTIKHNLLENDTYWYDIALKDYGDIMVDMSSRGDFGTWKEYYNYLCFMFTNNYHRYIHLHSDHISVFGDFLDAIPYSGEKIQQTLSQYKRGDMIYCNGTGGAKYYLDTIVRNNAIKFHLNIIDSVSFRAIEEFPVTYWNSKLTETLVIIENHIWHQPLQFIYPHFLGIELTKRDVKDVTINNKQYKYFVFEHQNINYCIEFLNNFNSKKHSGISTISDKNFWNNKKQFLCRKSCSGENITKYKLFLDYLLINYKISSKQLLIADF